MLKVILLKTFSVLALLAALNAYAQETVQLRKIVLNKNWYIQQSDKINRTGSEISLTGINPSDWYRTSVPATIMGALTANGLYEDLFLGDNYKKPDKKQFDGSWWYYTQFEIPQLESGSHAILQFDGINYYANIWLNGKLLASRDSVYGTFRRFGFDVSSFLKAGKNQIAVEIFRAQPGDFNMGFVDWNPRPADENMGIWREVYLKVTGAVSLKNTYVESDVNTITLDEAALTVKTSISNNSEVAVNGFLTGRIEADEFRYPVSVGAGETKEIILTKDQIPSLTIKNPRLWWCNNLGSPELYKLELSFESERQITDSERVTFGIRKIESYTNAAGHKGFKLNGKPLLIKGAGWTDDIFLRDSLQSLEIQMQYVKHMNLNTLRFESVFGNTQDVYDLCDKYGILAMVGWSCQWEWDEYLGKPCNEFGGILTEKEMELALNSFRDQILWLRNHPGIFVWMAGSDKCPKPELELKYAELFKKLDNRPYLASAGTRVSSVSGPTGVKMNGPYEFVSPNYWYIDTINGGAFGFNTETGPGPQVPGLESLKKMIPSGKLWPPNEMWNYHCTHSIQAFNTMDVFNRALDERYGISANIEEYLQKSDAQSYEAMKAMFEAFRVNIPKSTGIIQWMLNSAWPSLYWQLYDYYLRPTASYYAARCANQPVQLIYNYGNNSVYVVNETLEVMKDLKATVKILDSNSVVSLDMSMNIDAQPITSEQIIPFDSIHGTLFLDLKLHDAQGKLVASNFYWLSEKQDQFAWEKTTWAYTPMKSYTDYSALNQLKPAGLKIIYSIEEKGNDLILHTSISNQGDVIAFGTLLGLTDEMGESIYPVFFDDNYISLLPGEQREISCVVAKETLKGKVPTLQVSGWNVAKQTFTVK